MNMLIVSLDCMTIQKVLLTKDRTRLGRHPHNDIVVDHPTVSGEHAVLHLVGNDVLIEDLGGTGGTYVEGKAVRKQLLFHCDRIQVGDCRIKYLLDEGGPEHGATVAPLPRGARLARPPGGGLCWPPLSGTGRPVGLIKVLNGAAAGREVALTKDVTTVGRPGVQVGSIAKGPQGYAFAHLEGAQRPQINGSEMRSESVTLRSGDVIDLAGIQVRFICG